MRVGYGCQLVSDRPFGVSYCILELARALAKTKQDHSLRFYVRRHLPALSSEAQVVAPALARFRLGRIAWDQLALPRRAVRDQLDVFHAPGYVMPLRMGVPTVLTVYDLLALTHPEYCKPTNRWHYGMMVPWSLRRARSIIACSHAVRRELLDRFAVSEGRVRVIAPGVEDALRVEPPAEELERTRQRYSLSAPFALFVGNHEPKKNLRALITAFGKLRERGEIDGDLVLTGGGGWGRVLRDIGSTPGLRILPYVSRPDLYHLYRLALFLAFPSLAEGFGLPVLEAMAAGLPVVCSNVPVVEETDPGAVLLVDPCDEESIAEGLSRMWREPDLRAAASRRGRISAERFTWESAARETWNVYREVVEE